MKRVFYFIFLMSFCILTGQAQNDFFTGEFSQQELSNFSKKNSEFSIQKSKSSSLIFENGGIVTDPNAGPGGSHISKLQSPNTAFGFKVLRNTDNSVVDDFNITTTSASIDSVVFYMYQTASGNYPSIIDASVRIWNGAPNVAGCTVIWGNLMSNSLHNCYFSNIYRAPNLTNTDRPVMRVVCATPNLSLPPGNYWIEIRSRGNVTLTGPYAVPVTIAGQPQTGNALWYDMGVWQPCVDHGNYQGIAFELHGTTININRDIEITSLVAPHSSYTLTNSESIQVILQNNGTESATQFPVKYSINNGSIISEMFTGSLLQGDTTVFTFSQTVDFSSPGTSYQLKVFHEFANDEINANDTISETITNMYGLYCDASGAIENSPYIEQVSCNDFINNTGSLSYMDYTSLTDTVTYGITDTITVSMRNFKNWYRLKAWADWNKNGFLEDTGENLFTNFNYVDSVIQIYVNVPGNALPGHTRIRLRTFNYHTNNSSCGYYIGETEDYSLFIKGTPLQNDAMSFICLNDSIADDEAFAPEAIFVNFSASTKTFDVTCTDGTVYSSVKTITNLEAGDSIKIKFDNISPTLGYHTLSIFTSLQNDENNGNDTIRKTIHVMNLTKVFAYNSFIESNAIPKGPVITYLEQPGLLKLIADQSQEDYVLGACWINGKWYASSHNEKKFFTIDTLIGERILIGTLAFGVHAMAYDYFSNILYGLTYDGANTNLYSININNGQMQYKGALGNKTFISLACDKFGRMYSLCNTDNRIYKINPENGNATSLQLWANFHPWFAQEMDFDHRTGICYLGSFNCTDADDNHGELRRVDVSTGLTYPMGRFYHGANIAAFTIPSVPVYDDVDAGVYSLLSPQNSGVFSSTQTIQAVIRNYGTTAISNFDVSYKLNNEAVITETFSGVLNPGSATPFAFTTTCDMSQPAYYTIKLFTSLNGDTTACNDTLLVTVENISLASNDIPNNDEMNIYFNQINAELTLLINDKNTEFQIYNILGQIMYKEMLNENKQFRITDKLSKGMYIVSLKNKNRGVVKKIIF